MVSLFICLIYLLFLILEDFMIISVFSGISKKSGKKYFCLKVNGIAVCFDIDTICRVTDMRYSELYELDGEIVIN